MVKIAICPIHVFKKWSLKFINDHRFASNNICQDKYKFKITSKWNFLSPHSDMSPQHFKIELSHQIQCWLCINCGREFVWEMTYALQSSNISSGGNILLMKIKIKCPTGKHLEIMTFRYLKNTTLFDVFIFEEYY